METSDAWIQERTGIRERRWVREGTENSDLALEATKRALAKAGWEAKDLDAIVYASLSPDHMFPATAASSTRSSASRVCPPSTSGTSARLPLRPLRRGRLDPRGVYRRGCSSARRSTRPASTSRRAAANVAVIFGDGAAARCSRRPTSPVEACWASSCTPTGARPRDLFCDAPGSMYHPRVQAAMIESGAVYARMEGQKVFKNAIVRMPRWSAGCSSKTASRPRT